MSEPTCRALCYSDAGCLSIVRTYLLGTVLQGCRLLYDCLNLPIMYCVAGVQAVLAMAEPTCHALCYSGADCLSGVGTYLSGTVLQWGRLFKWCRNLPDVHCVTVVKADLAMSEFTCKALCYIGKSCLRSVRTYLPGTCVADCFSNVRTYLRGPVLQGCRRF